jgi:hypothetical protein
VSLPILDPKKVPEGWVTDIFGIVHPPAGQTWVRSLMGDVEYFTDWTPLMKRALAYDAAEPICEITGLPRRDCALCQRLGVHRPLFLGIGTG